MEKKKETIMPHQNTLRLTGGEISRTENKKKRMHRLANVGSMPSCVQRDNKKRPMLNILRCASRTTTDIDKLFLKALPELKAQQLVQLRNGSTSPRTRHMFLLKKQRQPSWLYQLGLKSKATCQMMVMCSRSMTLKLSF